jgi:two-component sensor histidine kinase
LTTKIGQLYDPSDRHLVSCDIADVRLAHNQAAVVGQVLTELLINVYRHAFAMREGGTAIIRLVALEGWLELTVADNGPGATRPETGRGHLGLAIIANLARSLDGSFDYACGTVNGRGFTGRLRFPQMARNGD